MYRLHIVEPYSSCGHPIVLYAASRTPSSFVLTFRLMKPSDLFALGVILFMRVLKLKLVERSIPRYLTGEAVSSLIMHSVG